MKYLIFLMLLSSSAGALDRSNERPIITFKRIKKELRRQDKSAFSLVGFAAWAAGFVALSVVLGWMFVLLFGGGCVLLWILVELFNYRYERGNSRYT